jgi:hypothetical protein
MSKCIKGMIFIISIVVLLSLPGCSTVQTIQEQLGISPFLSGEGTLDVGNPSIPEDKGVGGGGEDDGSGGLQGSGAIGTAIQQTVDTRNTMTAVVQITETPASNPQSMTDTVKATLTVPAQQLTELAQTLTAIVVSSTPTIDQLPTIAPTPTATYTPSPEPTDFTPEPTEAPCNAFRFVSHVTFPPGSIVQPDTGFYKSWYVQNTGSCTWTPSYSLVYHSGFQLGGRSPLNLNGYIQPGEFAVLSIQLYSNPQPNTYEGRWWLLDPQGHSFGGGANRDEPLLVNIIVPGQPQPVFTSPVVTSPPFYTSTPSP